MFNPSRMTIHRLHCSGNGMKSSNSNPQSTFRCTKDKLKIVLLILSTTESKISFLLHARELSLYVWVYIHRIRICTLEESQILCRSNCFFRCASFHAHLPHHHIMRSIPRHQLRGTLGLVYNVITLQGICARFCLSGRGVIFPQGENIKSWEHIHLVALKNGQEVESYDKMRKERDHR